MHRVYEVRRRRRLCQCLLVFRDRQSGGPRLCSRALGCLHLLALSAVLLLALCSGKVRMQRATPAAVVLAPPVCGVPGRLPHLVADFWRWTLWSFAAVQRSLLGLPAVAFLKGVPLGVAWFGRGSVCVQLYQTETNLASKVAEPTCTPIFLPPCVIFCSIGTCGAWRELCCLSSDCQLFQACLLWSPISGIPSLRSWLYPALPSPSGCLLLRTFCVVSVLRLHRLMMAALVPLGSQQEPASQLSPQPSSPACPCLQVGKLRPVAAWVGIFLEMALRLCLLSSSAPCPTDGACLQLRSPQWLHSAGHSSPDWSGNVCWPRPDPLTSGCLLPQPPVLCMVHSPSLLPAAHAAVLVLPSCPGWVRELLCAPRSLCFPWIQPGASATFPASSSSRDTELLRGRHGVVLAWGCLAS